MVKKNVLVIGSGGREHAICWKLAQSSNVGTIFALPGNPGIAELIQATLVNDISANDFPKIVEFCKKSQIELVAVGPEVPLSNGIADELQKAGIKCFGPIKAGARIESDKNWSKQFMIDNGIPTARYESFTDVQKAKDHIAEADYDALVVKATGLAAGKGVIVAKNKQEAYDAVDEILGQKKYGTAGDTIIIEELLQGQEVSLLAFIDGTTVRLLLPSQDHKRLLDNDRGPNTGGMGAYCPYNRHSDCTWQRPAKKILENAVAGFNKLGIKYCGILYAGLMVTSRGVNTLEFNCRFGDPETEVILPLLKDDLFEIMMACCESRLHEIEQLKWRDDYSAVGVVLASGGYPDKLDTGYPIYDIPRNDENHITFHCGTSGTKGSYKNAGGRVLITVALEKTLKEAAEKATAMCENISLEGSYHRSDIAKQAFTVHRSDSLSYKQSGVDIDAGEALVQRIKPLARGTDIKGVIGGLGGFGGLFQLNELGIADPVIVESTKGIGLKVKLALRFKKYEYIGNDLVALCANEVVSSGARPIGFLDYIACGKLVVPVAAQIVKGIADSCRDIKCALLGGETAEMPTVFRAGSYDVAGYCMGVVNYDDILPTLDSFEDGDIVLGFLSDGLHCDGYEIIQDIIESKHISYNDYIPQFKRTLGEIILQPTRCFTNDVLTLCKTKSVKAVINISGTGIRPILNNVLNQFVTANNVNHNIQIHLDADNFDLTKIYGWLLSHNGITEEIILDNFNCGIGLICVVSKSMIPIWEKIKRVKQLGIIRRNENPKAIEITNLTKNLKQLLKEFDTEDNETKINFQIALKSHERFIHYENISHLVTAETKKRMIRVKKLDAYKDPVLVLGTDGVGTKIRIAHAINEYDTVGIDLVAMCTNDILCNGANPLTFLEYYGNSKGSDHQAIKIVAGILEGCRQSECKLIGGTTINSVRLYPGKEFDLAGFAAGIVERDKILPKMDSIKVGDVLIGLPSEGAHSNGFSLVHRIMALNGHEYLDRAEFSGYHRTYGDEFLHPTKIYVKALKPLFKEGYIKAAAHITGGGLLENIPRVLPKEMAVTIDGHAIRLSPMFAWLSKKGNVILHEMLRTFNCGIGMVIVVDQSNVDTCMRALKFKHHASVIGTVIKRGLNTQQVEVKHFDIVMNYIKDIIQKPKKRIGVLISGNGSNLQALIDATRNTHMGIWGEIVAVFSNKGDAYGLQRAKTANIPTRCFSHKEFKTREEFDTAIERFLEEQQVDIVCLAGFMRILSIQFVAKWKNKLINIHPSLLPRHRGLNVQHKALEAGDTESGCTIHYVDEGIDTGEIIHQEIVPIYPGDTVENLTNRIHEAEHYAYPIALRKVIDRLL